MTKVQLLTDSKKPIYQVLSVQKAYAPENIKKGWIRMHLNSVDHPYFSGLNRRDFRVIHD